MAWEIIERNELTIELEEVRKNSIMEFFQMFFMKDVKQKDLQAIIMLIGSAISYLVIRSQNIDLYGGIDLGSEKGWKRIEDAVDTIIKGILKV
jgi:hypothetical protein